MSNIATELACFSQSLAVTATGASKAESTVFFSRFLLADLALAFRNLFGFSLFNAFLSFSLIGEAARTGRAQLEASSGPDCLARSEPSWATLGARVPFFYRFSG